MAESNRYTKRTKSRVNERKPPKKKYGCNDNGYCIMLTLVPNTNSYVILPNIKR